MTEHPERHYYDGTFHTAFVWHGEVGSPVDAIASAFDRAGPAQLGTELMCGVCLREGAWPYPLQPEPPTTELSMLTFGELTIGVDPACPENMIMVRHDDDRVELVALHNPPRNIVGLTAGRIACPDRASVARHNDRGEVAVWREQGAWMASPRSLEDWP